MQRILHLAAFILAAAFCSIAAADQALLPQRPAISKTHVAFGYAGDLWLVGLGGGAAQRLTSGVGLEFQPYFSPDGSKLALTAEYDGNLDVYVVAATGGEPRRLTFHPGADVALGWTPDGKSILFSSGRTSYSRFNKLFTVDVEGSGFAKELPLPMGEQGAYSPDGLQLAYVPFWNRRAVPNAYIAWKHYRGGKASPIWIANLADSRIEKIPRTDSSDFCPMWLGGRVYFLSDREGKTTLFSYDPQSKEVRREISGNAMDLISAAAGPDAIVCEQIGSLSIFDPATRQARPLPIQITADFPDIRPHFTKVGEKITGAGVSPSGVRAVFEARGEILTVPAEKGDIRNLTQTTAAAERDPAWSPDGKTIAYFSDESGEYQLHLRDARGIGETKKIALGDAPNFYSRPAWSPDSTKIAYGDNRNILWYVEIATGQSTKVAGDYGNPDAAWSPDSRWLAFTQELPNRLAAVFLFDTLEEKKPRQVTDGMSDARFPAFDKGGKHLYFTASTDIGPTTNGIDMSGMNRPVTRSVYLAVLDKDLPSPLAPESDEEKEEAAARGRLERPTDKPEEGAEGAGDDKPDAAAGEKKPERKPARPAPTKIDLENIGQRILALPIPGRNYMGLQAGKSGVIFLLERPQTPTPPEQPGQRPTFGATVHKFDLKTRKMDKLLDGVRNFELAASGEKALWRSGQRWTLGAIPGGGGPERSSPFASRAGGGDSSGAGGAGGSGGGGLKTDEMEVYVDPRAEWRQMYREAWRLQRDFLYDPHYHGLDLAAAEKKYAPYLDGVAHRADLNYLFNEMLGEMVLGHTYISGGDTPEVKAVKGGLLGADFTSDGGRYRFARIYSGENWNPQLRAPLTQPGVNVKVGDYLLAVNGKELRDTDSLYKAFEATAGKSVILRVGPQPDGAEARDVTVVPVESETALRNLAWVEDNRRKVDEMSGGKVAYVYLPDTGSGGYANFNRYFFAQVDKPAVVLDERFNGGGKAADYIIDYLRRDLLNYWSPRDGRINPTPGGAIFGPKAMIINEFAGSGGDAMPWYFRRAKLGPLVGKRTWGGLVGISGYPPLLDGGSVTAPSFAFFTPEGTWDVENHGVPPDVEVEHDPYEVRQGRDPQLEKAVALVLEALEKNPPPTPKRPAFPNYQSVRGDAPAPAPAAGGSSP